MKNLLRQSRHKSFRSQSLNLFLIRFFSTAATFLVVYFYSHHLSENDYGIYQTIWTQTAFFNAFAGLGLASLVFTYTPEKLIALIKNIRFGNYCLLFLIPVFCGGFFVFLQQFKGESAVVFFLFFLAFTLCNLLEVTLTALQQFKLLPVISLLYAIGFCWIHYRALHTAYDNHALFKMLLFLLCIKLLLLFIILFFTIYKKQSTSLQEAIDLKPVRLLWMHLYFFEASQVVLSYLDKFILSNVLDEKQFALYFNATMSIPFLSLLFSAVANAGMMQLSKEKNAEKQIAILHHIGKALATVAFPCFFFFLFFSREVFIVVFSEKYLEALPIFICSLLSLPLRAFSFTALLQIHHKGKQINQGVLIDLTVSIVLSAPLYFGLGLKGVALAFVIGTFAQAAYYLHHSGKLVNTQPLALLPLKKWLVKFLYSGVLLFAAHYFFQKYLQPMQVLIACGLFIVPLFAMQLWRDLKEQS